MSFCLTKTKQNDPKQALPHNSTLTNLENEPLELMTENNNLKKQENNIYAVFYGTNIKSVRTYK